MNHDNASFYLAVNTCKNQNSSKPWFKKSAVGLHKLKSLMKTMAEKAGLGPNVKNHSGRKTMIQTITNKEIPATDIIQLCGHKNLQSVTNYSIVSEKQQAKISRTLSDLSTGTGSTNRNEFISICWNSATAALTDGQQSQQAMSLFTGAVIHSYSRRTIQHFRKRLESIPQVSSPRSN